MKSNCLFKAIILRLKLKGSKIHMLRSKYSPFPHFCVEYKHRVLWFKAVYSDEPWYLHVWYEGKIAMKLKRK